MLETLDFIVFNNSVICHDAGSAGAVVMEIVVPDNEIGHIDRRHVDTGSLSGELGSFDINSEQSKALGNIGRIQNFHIFDFHLVICGFNLFDFGFVEYRIVFLGKITDPVSGLNEVKVLVSIFASCGAKEISLFRNRFHDIERSAVQVDGVISDKAELVAFDDRSLTSGSVIDGVG